MPAAVTAPARPAAVAGEPLLRVVGVAKAFGPTQALSDARLELRAGEVHALVGENGSGKSTLVKILSGVHRPDAGHLELEGTRLTSLRSPAKALAAGLATVYQEVLSVGPQTVLDNVWMGVDPLFRRAATSARKRTLVGETLARIVTDPPDLDARAEALSLSDRQACSIARAVVRRPQVLILDEATSALDYATRDRLFALLRELAAQGTAIVFISHRMDEIGELADRVTVMRSGATVGTVSGADAEPDRLVAMMTGADSLVGAPAHRERAGLGASALTARGLRLRPGATPVDFELRAGEIVGLAGLEGHGQDAFLQALRGKPGSGIAYVPRERRAEALFMSMSIRENFGLPTLRRDRGATGIRASATAARLEEWIGRLAIKAGDARAPIATLSGGNQQKVVLARWLATQPRVLLLNDPTRGIDLGAKRDLYRVLVELAGEGMAIVMLSTEVDEHVELMDRVLVFRDHELAAELQRDRLTRRNLVSAFFGREAS